MVSLFALGETISVHSEYTWLTSSSVWQFYDTEASEVSDSRPSLLLRILVVDVQPFQTLLSELLNETTDWTIR